MSIVKIENPRLIIIVPCYNEQEVLPITSRLFESKLEQLIDENTVSKDSCILLVDDGSDDETWDYISYLSDKSEHFTGIRLSRNFGHQYAILAGLMEMRKLCDITITMDCDGQDDLNAVDKMIASYCMGNEVVYGVRLSRNKDTFFKKKTAELFYNIMHLFGCKTIFNHADFRLISSRVLNEFVKFKETNLFLRGLIPLVGFKSDVVYYDRNERIAGKTHYPLRKMTSLAIDGLTSLSVKPIRLITMFGGLISFMSFILIIWTIVERVKGVTVAGWASMTSLVAFLGGVQILSLGIIGEYIGKIYMEAKHRPRYIISDRTDNTMETSYE